MAYHRNGQLEEALYECGEALRCEPADKLARFQRGVIYSLDPAQHDKAEIEFKEALRIDPVFIDA